jgi:hypothetical protein
MDAVWWKAYGTEARQACKGKLCAPSVMGAGVHRVDVKATNSGAGALRLAAQCGAKRIVMLGYDGQKTGGRSHWHADHPAGLGNAGSVDLWPAQFAKIAGDMAGVEIINASRDTAITAFPRSSLPAALSESGALPDLVVDGMNGLGDNLHQRALVRELVKAHTVWLKTPWPSLYHDLAGQNLRLVNSNTRLRTQAKNARREAAAFTQDCIPSDAKKINVSYPPALVRKQRGVLSAMAAQVGLNAAALDLSLPVPADWQHGLKLPAGRPVIVFRPLTERREWGGNVARNPDPEAYLPLYRALRDLCPNAYIVSVADLEDGKEWVIHPAVDADLCLHAGELDIRQLAALVRDASLVFTAPGMALVLAQAVGTPVVCVFGGYESAYSFSAGAKRTPTLAIEPMQPCDCFSHKHACRKSIDMASAEKMLEQFVSVHLPIIKEVA